MLLNQVTDFDLAAKRQEMRTFLPDEVKEYFESTPEKLYVLEYPVLQYPAKIKSLNLVTTPVYSGKLIGIKGQYLIFEDGTVMNVRAYEGFSVQINV